MYGPEGRHWHFPDLPEFVLGSDWLKDGPSYIQDLEQLQAYLDAMKSRGLPVPQPTSVREIMADPAHRVPHRIFDLGDLHRHQQLLDLQRKIDQRDAAAVRRYLGIYEREGDRFLGQLEFEPPPGLTRLQAIFGCSIGDLMYDCFPIAEEHANALGPYLNAPLELNRYDYFLEAEGREDESSVD